MDKTTSLRATMITNFDSTEQRQEWNDIVQDCPAYPRIVGCGAGPIRIVPASEC